MEQRKYKFCPECGEVLAEGPDRLPKAESAAKERGAPLEANEPAAVREPAREPLAGVLPVPGAPSIARGDAPAGTLHSVHAYNAVAHEAPAPEAPVPVHDAYHDFIAPAPEPDVSAPHDAYREFAPPTALMERDAQGEAEPEVWLRPDGWTPDDGEDDGTLEAVEAAGASIGATAAAPEAPRRAREKAVREKKPRLARFLPVFLLALVLIGGAAGFAVLKLREGDAPARAAERFAASVYTGDTKYVLAHMETSGSGLASAEDVAAMCEAIKEAVAQKQLEQHLLTQGDTMAHGYSEALSSLQMREVKSGLLSQKFAVRVAAVPVLVRTGIDESALYVDGERKTPTPVSEGLLLELAPGKHELRAAYEEYGKEYELGTATVSSFSSATQEVTLSQSTASVSIELSGVESNLAVKVDGRAIRPEHSGGWVTLDPAFVGMEIELTCDEYAQSIDITSPGKQIISVDYITVMQDKNPGGRDPNPDLLTNRQLAEKLGKRFYTCYRSYLEASNSGNEGLIRDADEAYKVALISNINNFNSGYLFEFKSIEADYRSVTRFEEDEKQFATVRVEVLYNYTKRTGEPNWLAGFNRQDVTLVYDETRSDWLVYGSKVDDSLVLTEDTFTVT